MSKNLNYRYYIVYLTINKKNGNYYIGKHATDNLNDSYIGSGTLLKRAIKKHGRSTFERTILYIFTTYEEADLVEAALVTEDTIRDPRCYNKSCGGQGGNLGEEVNKRKGPKVAAALKGKPKSDSQKLAQHLAMKGRKQDPLVVKARATTFKKNISKMTDDERRAKFGRSGENNPFFQKTHKKESLDMMRATIGDSRKRGKSVRAKPVTIEGVTYACIKDAEDALGKTKYQIRRILYPPKSKKLESDWKHYRAIEVEINGVKYCSLAEAAKELGISTYKIKKLM